MTGRSEHGSLGDDNAPQFGVVPDEDLTPDQLRQVQAIRAEIAARNPADTDPPSPRPSNEGGDQ